MNLKDSKGQPLQAGDKIQEIQSRTSSDKNKYVIEEIMSTSILVRHEGGNHIRFTISHDDVSKKYIKV